MQTSNLKTIIRAEYKKCIEDPIYFMKKYVKIQHPTRGTCSFDLFPFQEETLRALVNNDFNIILKSRQMGISTLVGAYSLWLMTFFTDKNILCISISQETSKEIVTRVRFANEHLPSWLKVKSSEDNRLSLRLENGSQIKAVSSAGTAGRSAAVSLLVVDEAAFIQNIEEIWLSSQYTLSCMDKRHLVLTDKGLIRLEDIIPDDPTVGFHDVELNICTRKSIQSASQFYVSPKSDLYDVYLESGHILTLTENHPVMTKSGWCDVKNLQSNADSILGVYNQNMFGKKIDYSQFSPTSNRKLKNPITDYSEIPYLCGLWVAEGHYDNNGIGITNSDPQIINLLYKYNFKCYKEDNLHFTLASKYVKQLFQWIGCSGTAKFKKVPSKILQASKPEQISFLQGLFDGDGCSLGYKGIKLTSASYELISNVRTMLLNFGIYSYIRDVEWKNNKSTVLKNTSTSSFGFELYISGWDSHKFYNDIGFRLSRKQDGHKKLSKRSIKRMFIDKSLIKDIIHENNYTILNFCKKYKCDVRRYLWMGSKGISITSIETILKVCNSNTENYKILKETYMSQLSEYWDLVVDVRKSKHDYSYDLRVPTEESFIADGYLQHNTGGKSVVLSCVTDDTYVYTDKGIKQVKDFIPSEKSGDYTIDEYNVCGVDKLRKSNLFKVNGKTDTIKLTTKFSQLEGSKIHKLWGYKSDTKNVGWVEMQDLTENDYISMQVGMDIWGNNDDISDFCPSKSSKTKSPINITKITNELSYLFGLYISKGSTYKVINKNSELIEGSITITCGDPEISWVFDALSLSYSCHDGIHYTISSKNLIELFEYIGFDLSFHAQDKQIPSRLLEMSKENIKWLLRGIFDGDGTASKGDISLTSHSLKLITQVRSVLLNFGVLGLCGCRSKETMNQYESVKNKFNHDIHYIEISGNYAQKYFNQIGFALKRKQDEFSLLASKNLNRNSSKNIIPNTFDLVKKLHELSGHTTYKLNKLHGININGILNKKNRYKTEHISREIVLLLYNTYGGLLTEDERVYWDKIINDNIVWVKIKNISYGCNDVYDFSLPDNIDDFWCHSIIYNGIIGHQTPNGVGNWFHKTWVDSEAGENEFHTIRLPWHLHPERDQSWRDKQTLLSGVKGAAQECDCDFATSGNQVVEYSLLEFQKETYVIDPIEKRGPDGELWIWERPDYSKNYIVSADCARGDGSDYSACHVIDVESAEQVAEYRGRLGTKDYGNFLVSLATEYNNALLVVENNNIGWATLQQIIDRNYDNLFYTDMDLKVVDPEKNFTNKLNSRDKKSVPGFTTTQRNRPLMVSKLEAYFVDKSITIHSIRTYDELCVFIWNGAKAEAMRGYNDDLVMSLAIGLWIRDTALKLRLDQMAYNKSMIEGITRIAEQKKPRFFSENTPYAYDANKTWKFTAEGKKEDLTWLL